MRTTTAIFVAALAFAASAQDLQATNFGVCGFSDTTLKFAGTIQEEAKCLLRKVRPRGSGADAQPIPDNLLNRVGTAVDFTKTGLRKYLETQGVAEGDIGGSLDGAMRFATRADGTKVPAAYFIIHDTSSPELPETPSFPANMDDSAWSGNRIASPGWADTAKRVNLIVNRAGKSRTFVDFGDSHPKSGTKLEGCARVARDLFVQIENIQPRMKPSGSWGHIAPNPGFSDAQLKRLALLYVSASLRSGTWMIPAFHFNVDQEACGEPHDDPQNFDLARWVGFIDEIATAARTASQ